jgi:hypothetical protein
MPILKDTSGSCSNKAIQPISAPYNEHILTPLKYFWTPKSLDFAQHYLGTVTSAPLSEAVPSYPPTTSPCVANIPKKPNTYYCPINNSDSTYASHQLQPLKPLIALESIPLIQHYNGAWPAYPKSTAEVSYPPPPIKEKKGLGYCVCPQNQSSGFASHNINPPKIIVPLASNIYSAHYLGPYPTYPKTEAPFNPESTTGFCQLGTSSCLSQPITASTYVSHQLQLPIVQNADTLSAPFVSHSQNVFPSKYIPKLTNRLLGAPSFATGPCLNPSRPKSSCRTKLPDSTPYTQHILSDPSYITPTLGLPFGSHISQEHVRDCGGTRPPTLACVGTMFDSTIYIQDSRWSKYPQSIPFVQHTLIDMLPKNNTSINSTFGPHGLYPNLPEVQTYTSYCDPAIDSIPYGDHKWRLQPDLAFTDITNSKSPGTIITKDIDISTGEITYNSVPETCPKADIPFSNILNWNVKIGEKQCSPFGQVSNRVGPGIKKEAWYQITCNNIPPLAKPLTELSCNTLSLPLVQHTRYKEVPFSSVSNNPHQLNYLE